MVIMRFVRHGETDWNRHKRVQGTRDIPLNAVGMHQARRAAERLGDATYGGFYTSPLTRARQTATQLAQVLDLPSPSIVSALSERDFGSAEGLLWAESRQRFDGDLAPDAEDAATFSARTWGAVELISRQHTNQTVLVVGHGFSIVSLLERAGMPQLPDPGAIENGSVTDFLVENGRIELRSD